jgi:hypothetical protein
VNWLHGKARYDWWCEELKSVKSEMRNTIHWLQCQKVQWEARHDKVGEGSRGHICYAAKQMVMWTNMIAQAEIAFAGKMD